MRNPLLKNQQVQSVYGVLILLVCLLLCLYNGSLFSTEKFAFLVELV